jgi:hypothetical protein
MKKPIKRKKQPEYELQKAICQYLSLQYPNVLFLSDTIASLKLTPQQQVRNSAIQKRGFHCPDLIILQPNKFYFGLFIELKIETPFKKNGEIKASQNDHLSNQLDTIQRLDALEYYAVFAWSFEQAKKIIDDYLKDVK